MVDSEQMGRRRLSTTPESMEGDGDGTGSGKGKGKGKRSRGKEKATDQDQDRDGDGLKGTTKKRRMDVPMDS